MKDLGFAEELKKILDRKRIRGTIVFFKNKIIHYRVKRGYHHVRRGYHSSKTSPSSSEGGSE